MKDRKNKRKKDGRQKQIQPAAYRAVDVNEPWQATMVITVSCNLFEIEIFPFYGKQGMFLSSGAFGVFCEVV